VRESIFDVVYVLVLRCWPRQVDRGGNQLMHLEMELLVCGTWVADFLTGDQLVTVTI
jgi:hypothetical protein